MKNYKITTQNVIGFPKEDKETGKPTVQLVQAESEDDLMVKMGWKIDADYDEDWESINEFILECINSERTFYYDYNQCSYVENLSNFDGYEGSEGERTEVQVLSDKEMAKETKILEKKKEEKEQEKLKKAEKNAKKWDKFFQDKDMLSAIEELKGYKFPKKIEDDEL